MTKDVRDAIQILGTLYDEMDRPGRICDMPSRQARQVLVHAIGHLAYPDRDVYPKTRRATKGAPIVRK